MYKKYFKRSIDFIITLFGFICISPLFLVLCLLVKHKLGSPIFFKQVRIGKDEKPFKMIKFRTMLDSRDENGNLLPDTDRFAKFGDFLRNSSLDELPELINVIKGDMSLVGPRPEVRKYVDMYTTEQRRVLAVRPGITDYASIVYMDENRLLGQSSNPDKTYVEDIMPAKIELNMRYINHPTLFEYFKLIFLTIFKIAR